MRALEMGAVDVIHKPAGVSRNVEQAVAELVAKIGAVLQSKYDWRRRRPLAKAAPAARRALTAVCRNAPLVALGASTGGTEALFRILQELPVGYPASIVVVQHMPEGFTRSFAARLNDLCAIEVREAEHHDILQPGRALIAPGNYHLEVRCGEFGAYVELSSGAKVSGHRPSVDVLFASVARSFGANAVGALLTGMGRDGATGLLQMRRAGALTIAQDEASCVVFGMPKAAIDDGAVEIIADLAGIPQLLMGAGLSSERPLARSVDA
jgi:two-component system, chemotaxis family, protein-glutamate methylesterase/glutaminase